jgi:hypothetical protein
MDKTKIVLIHHDARRFLKIFYSIYTGVTIVKKSSSGLISKQLKPINDSFLAWNYCEGEAITPLRND